jgi:2-polyprenyl-3-methyl-5-hydroxy-6-metoxy-1,4-benzoquinol methylase
VTPAAVHEVAPRARLSLGRADTAIHDVAAQLLAARRGSGTLADIGCGQGHFRRQTRALFAVCHGIDAVRYEGLPADVVFHRCDLDREPLPLGDRSVDAAVALEVIEHLENPRAFCREVSRIVRPGGLIVLSTPNQGSALSLLTLLLKGQFAAFQARDYPAHRTALLEIDLRRIAAECGWTAVEIVFTRHGRVPLTGRHYPAGVAALAPRRFSDNVVLVAQR